MINVNIKSHFLFLKPLLESMLPVVNLWKLPEGEVDSLSGPFLDFVVSGSQDGGGRLPLDGRRGWWDEGH